jgi:hypothetical protein
MNTFLLFFFFRKHKYEQQKKKKIQQKRSVGRFFVNLPPPSLYNTIQKAIRFDVVFILCSKTYGLEGTENGV